MFNMLIGNWKTIAIAFAAGLAVGYVGAVFQFEHAVLSHTDKAVTAQHQADVKQHAVARDVSKAAQRRHDIGVHTVAEIEKRAQALPESPAACDLPQITLDLLNEAGQ